MTDFGDELTRLMRERGRQRGLGRDLGVREVARDVHVNAGHISNLRNGNARASEELAARLDSYLNAGGSLIKAWKRDRAAAQATLASAGTPVAAAISTVALADLTDLPARPPPGSASAMETLSQWDRVDEPARPAVLAAGQASPREIARLEETALLFRTWDHQHGGGLGRKAVAGQLAEMAALLTQPHPDTLRRRLLGVASQLALTVASMTSDAGSMPRARQYLELSLKTAREARDASLGARAVNAMARRVLDDGNPWLAHDMLRHALRSLRDLPGDMTALLYTTDAWTCATLGDYGQMALCLEEAASLTGGPDSLFGAAELAGIAGACYETLAARVRQPERASHIAQAEACITEALQLREPFYARSRVLDLAGLANVRLVQGEPEEAIRTASEALSTAVGLRSDRATRRVHGLAIRALELYPGVPAVAEFTEVVRSRLPVAPPA
jgi:hypothetical protein